MLQSDPGRVADEAVGVAETGIDGLTISAGVALLAVKLLRSTAAGRAGRPAGAR